ncbi:glycosyltransferase family 4 protein [Aquirufa antheringensis]|uniref:glycosyltransferase family 4 protein n=1 Tax=Aquirufa antheringensis TaxID=2516559 RepID=UPI003BAF70A4
MKIVHLCLSSFFIDDYSYQENMLPKYHVKQGHDVTVIASLVSFDKFGKPCLLSGESSYITSDNFKVIRLDYKKPLYQINKYIRLYRNTYAKIKSESPDLIFIHDFSFFDILSVIFYICNNRKVKVFVDCHTDFINSAQSWISKYIFHYFLWMCIGKILSNFVVKFYGVTPLRRDFLRDVYRIDKSKIELLVMGVDDDILKGKVVDEIRLKLTKRLNFKNDDFIIVTGGKIDDKKNIHLVMQAVANLGLEKVKLVVFGVVAPEMRSVFERLLLNNNINFIGWLDTDEIIDLFISSDLIVFPGTHSVLWEQAVGIGKPCIFKYWHGMDHVDMGGNCRFLYEDSVVELELLLSKLIYSSEYFDMLNVANKVKESFYYSVISRRAIIC